MNNEIAMYVLSALILALGGISLFTQKVYKVDTETGQKVEIEIPFFGKLTTNYPALAFAFIGAAMAAFTFDRTSDETDKWLITGTFKAPQSEAVAWTEGCISLLPRQFQTEIRPGGKFEIEADIKKGRQFEDEIARISYSKACGGDIYDASIDVAEEYKHYKEGKSALLETESDRSRVYLPVEVSVAKKPSQ